MSTMKPLTEKILTVAFVLVLLALAAYFVKGGI
jgi:hypothetical protein